MEKFVFPIFKQPMQGNRMSLGWSQQVLQFNFDPAFSDKVRNISLEAIYDIGLYMVGGTETPNAPFRVNIYQHDGM